MRHVDRCLIETKIGCDWWDKDATVFANEFLLLRIAPLYMFSYCGASGVMTGHDAPSPMTELVSMTMESRPEQLPTGNDDDWV